MSIAYPPELEQFVQQELASGACRSEDELVINALQVYRELKLRHDQLRQRVAKSLEQADRGELDPWDIDAILDEAHRRHASRQA